MEPQPQPMDQPVQSPPPLEGMMAPEEPAPRSLAMTILSILGFVIIAGTVIGLFWWWLWMKSPFVLWLKIVLSIIPFAIFAAVI
jgi:hypothetical protein